MVCIAGEIKIPCTSSCNITYIFLGSVPPTVFLRLLRVRDATQSHDEKGKETKSEGMKTTACFIKRH